MEESENIFTLQLINPLTVAFGFSGSIGAYREGEDSVVPQRNMAMIGDRKDEKQVSSLSSALANMRIVFRRAYCYQPLAEGDIRLLHLKPGEFGSPLYATLEHKSQQDAEGRYEAISYAWGEPVFPHKLHIKHKGIVKITDSLHSALQHLRGTEKRRTLWADAVCIDQQNHPEKAQQIRLMAGVFRLAQSVIIWLGPSEPSDALAFATMHIDARIRRDYFQSWNFARFERRMRNVGCCDCCSEPIVQTLAPEISGLIAVSRLLRRPWFTRLWVVQEQSAQSTSVCVCSGRHVAMWGSFVSSLGIFELCIQSFPERLPDGPNTRRDVEYGQRRINELPDLKWNRFDLAHSLHIIAKLSTRSCLDARDRILSMYDYLALHELRGFQPDYGLSNVELYLQFLIAGIKHSSNISRGHKAVPAILFGLAGTESPQVETESLPSWIPDFHALTGRSRKKSRLYEHQHYFRPFRTMYDRDHWCFAKIKKIRRGLLRVKARQFAIVTDILLDSSIPIVRTDEEKDLSQVDCSTLVMWYLRCRDHVRMQLGDHELDCRTMDFLSCGWDPADLPPTDPLLISKLRHRFESVCHSQELEMDRFLKSLVNVSALDLDTERNLCRISGSEIEHVGWVPKDALVGDLLFYFANCPFPFLLRERGDGTFTLIGDAYVYPTTLSKALGYDTLTSSSTILDSRVWEHPFEIDEAVRKAIDELDWITLQ